MSSFETVVVNAAIVVLLVVVIPYNRIFKNFYRAPRFFLKVEEPKIYC